MDTDSIPALAKLTEYALELSIDPLLAVWRAKREVKADTIRAIGEANIRQILASGEASAELQQQNIINPVELSQSPVAQQIYEDIEQRIVTRLEERFENLAAIVNKARLSLPDGNVPNKKPDIGWTSSFSDNAQHISDDEMQDLWAKILVGEVRSPGSTSVRTFGILRNLDHPTAQLFGRLCSLAISIKIASGRFLDCRVLSFGNNAAQNSLKDFGLNFDNLNVLNEHELVISDYSSYCDYKPFIGNQGFAIDGSLYPILFIYQGQLHKLVVDGSRDIPDEFQASGVSLTRAGRELSQVVEPERVPNYDSALDKFFASKSLLLKPIQAES